MGSKSRKDRSRSRSPVRSRRERDQNEKRDIIPISQDDYFKLNASFRLWLLKEKDRYFEDMDTEKARRYFASFVRAWNDGRLRSKYYKQDGELANLSKSVVTKHSWGFAKKLDQELISGIKEEVYRSTHSGGNASANQAAVGRTKRERPAESEQLFNEEQRERDHLSHRRERWRAKEREELILDEVAPKETGRSALLAKKRTLNAMRKVGKTLDVEIPDEELYVDSGSDLAALKRDREVREKRRLERRQLRSGEGEAERGSRLQEQMDKERSKVELLRAMALKSREQGLGMMGGSK
ncbi:hypothetical protein BX661DRAFT_142833 [Kickxella alabastrina]|uniref:uncharacterized protein n=1 Tax=Kickxella alabastrina TaxID=61397 RepID=UPI00221F4168|nr:uncharacterized protein BX661DRAFT_142833 [Kickxella alabastrina]KAI7828483.1 hypothetical protein BX661DRAFT_142833 [Kickxella alabastrina]